MSLTRMRFKSGPHCGSSAWSGGSLSGDRYPDDHKSAPKLAVIESSSPSFENPRRCRSALTCDDALESCSRAALHPRRVSQFPVSVDHGHMPYSGQTGVVAHRDDSRCTWPGTSQTYLNGSAHAAEACAPSSEQAGTVRDLGAGCCCVRPDTRQLTDCITLSGLARKFVGGQSPLSC